jgi:hypothetical protein
MTDVLDSEEVARRLTSGRRYQDRLVWVRMPDGTLRGVNEVVVELDEEDGAGFSRTVLELSDVTMADPISSG